LSFTRIAFRFARKFQTKDEEPVIVKHSRLITKVLLNLTCSSFPLQNISHLIRGAATFVLMTLVRLSADIRVFRKHVSIQRILTERKGLIHLTS